MDDPMDVDPPLPEHSQRTLAASGTCHLGEADVARILGLQILQQAQTRPAIDGYSLCSNGGVTSLVWSSNRWILEAGRVGSFPPLRQLPLPGWIRDQRDHHLCWDYVATDLFSIESVLNGLTPTYVPHCAWHICFNCRPDLLGTYPKAGAEHFCYAYYVEYALRHIQEHGVPSEFSSVFSCHHKPPTLIYYTPQPNRTWIRSVRTIATLEEALNHLPNHPIGADLIAYSQLFEKGDGIYYGPRAENVDFLQYHAVIIECVMWYRGEFVAYCKMSNGVHVADDGYAYVSLNTMFMIMGCDRSANSFVRPTNEPQHLLTNFVFLEMWKPEELAGSSTTGMTMIIL